MSDQLKNDVEQFRAAMSRSSFSDPGGVTQLRPFPKGTCKFASWLLARYLIEEQKCDQGSMEYVYGMRWSDKFTHGWVEYGEIILDITGDQFGEGRPYAVVTKERTWHDQFTDQGRYPFDDVFANLGEDWKQKLDRSYAEVIAYMD